MRIVVDEMPDTPMQCAYGKAYAPDVVGCQIDNIWCQDTTKCPFCIGLNQVFESWNVKIPTRTGEKELKISVFKENNNDGSESNP